MVGDAYSIAGGVRVMELTPAVARLFAEVFGEHLVAVSEADQAASAAREPLVFIAARALAPDAGTSWIPLFRVRYIDEVVSQAVSLGATVGAAPKAAPDTDLITASLRDPSGAPLILVCGAVASWELLDATHHIVALGRSR